MFPIQPPPPHFDATPMSEFQRGVKDCMPLLLGVVPLALVLDALANQKDFSLVEVPLLTGLNFAGGSEFAILEAWTDPPHLLTLIFITFLINSRYILLGATLVPYLRHLLNRKVFPALFFMVDESWAFGLADAQRRIAQFGLRDAFSMAYYAGLCFVLYLAWVGFTTLGALVGPVLGDIHHFGFDIAFPAIVLVLLRGMWKEFTEARPWLISFLCAGLAYTYLAGNWYVLIGVLSGIASAFWLIQEDDV